MIRAATSTGKYVSLVIASIVMLLPLGLILFGSFKTSQEFLSTGPMTPPSDWGNIENYVTAFTRGNMLQAFGNTIFIFGWFYIIRTNFFFELLNRRKLGLFV